MDKITQGTINFNVYEGQKRFIGLASADLPTLECITQSLQGAGIAGVIEAVMAGQFNAMTLGLHFQNVTSDAIRLATPGQHTLTLRQAVQTENPVDGAIEVAGIKHVFRVVHKTLGLGSVAPASIADASGEYGVRYWAMYDETGKQLLEIDVINNKYVVNGVDCLADVNRYI